MKMPSRDIAVLAIGQVLTGTVVSLLTSVSALSGGFLAPKPALSTLPVTATVIGTLIMIYPASMLMGRMGRRAGFMFKAGIGIAGGAVAMSAMLLHNFSLLIFGAFLLGLFAAFGQYYRFAAIDAAKNKAERASAIAIVTGMGVAGGIIGPYLGGHFANIIAGAPYAGAFLVLALICVALALSQLFLSANLGKNAETVAALDSMAVKSAPLKLGDDFFKASFICVIGFAVMTLIMNAAPLAIHEHGYNVEASARVLQVHFSLMYLPAFFNPYIIKIIGARGLVLLGIIAGGFGCALAAITEPNLPLYMAELGLAGICWNFMFNGGTLLLADTYLPKLKTKAQGLNSALVYSANVAASFAAGALLTGFGWSTLNLTALPLLALAIWAVFSLPRNM